MLDLDLDRDFSPRPGEASAAEIHAEALRLRAMLRGLLRVTARGR